MPSFITNLFPSSQSLGKLEDVMPLPPPPVAFSERPNTPHLNNFITPVSTPKGSPSKNKNPPGANELPIAFENAMKLTPTTNNNNSSRYAPSQSAAPSSPSKGNRLTWDESYFTTYDGNSHYNMAASSNIPLMNHGKENAPTSTRKGLEHHPNELPRPDRYPREVQSRKYNTNRGLTPEEFDILRKPNVKRLTNVTQLCELINLNDAGDILIFNRLSRLLL